MHTSRAWPRDVVPCAKHARQGAKTLPGVGGRTSLIPPQVPLLMLFYFGVVARSGTVVFERLDGEAFNTTGSPSSVSDSELYSAFGGTVGGVVLLGFLIWYTGKNL